MKTVLIIQAHFPPGAGPGVPRGFEFVKRLRGLGYEPVVITAAEAMYNNGSIFFVPTDDSRLREIPVGMAVYRVSLGWLAAIYARFLAKLRSWQLGYFVKLLAYPDPWVLWIWPVVKKAREVMRSKNIDVIFVTSPPASLCILSWLLKRVTNKPVVLDLRDPWTQNWFNTFPSKTHFKISQALERRIFNAVDQVISTTPTTRKKLLESVDALPPEKVTCIPNGYREEDWIEADKSDADSSRRFKLVYSGMFYSDPVLSNKAEVAHKDHVKEPQGASIIVKLWRRVLARISKPSRFATDIWLLPSFICQELQNRWSYRHRDFYLQAYSPAYLMKAMSELFNERPDLRGKIQFIHVGVPSKANMEYAASLGIEDAFEERGYVSHAEARELVRDADALFLCMGISPSNDRWDAVGQKVYEYLASHRPILALIPEGDARDILISAGTAVICHPCDISEIKSGLLDLIENRVKLQPNDEFIRQFSRQYLASELVQVLDQLVIGHSQFSANRVAYHSKSAD